VPSADHAAAPGDAFDFRIERGVQDVTGETFDKRVSSSKQQFARFGGRLEAKKKVSVGSENIA
jgi:hypothetical protein